MLLKQMVRFFYDNFVYGQTSYLTSVYTSLKIPFKTDENLEQQILILTKNLHILHHLKNP
jgi:hypothetical protein